MSLINVSLYRSLNFLTCSSLLFRVKNIEEKHEGLEEADVFLQEAQRQITEKNSALETLMKTRWDIVSISLLL